MQSGNRKAIIAALTANFGIAVAKFFGWTVTGAASMLAEAVHSLADTGNQTLLLWGASAAARAPTPEHPFGHGRERFFWAFVVALVIFSLGSLFAIYEGTQKLLHPHELSDPAWAIGILSLGIVLEGFSFRTAVIESRKVKGDASWFGFVRRSKSPELPVVLLEDLGAMIGLVMALIAVALTSVTGDARFDAAGSIVIGVLLGVIAIVLAIEMKSLLIGESASRNHREEIVQVIRGSEAVCQLIHLKTQHLGPDELLIAAKIEFAHELTVSELARAINRVESNIRAAIPVDCMIYVEPDIYDESRSE